MHDDGRSAPTSLCRPVSVVRQAREERTRSKAKSAARDANTDNIAGAYQDQLTVVCSGTGRWKWTSPTNAP